MHVIDTRFKRRALDNKWMKLIKILDNENSYSYKNDAGSTITLVPSIWVIENVYDYEIILEDK